MKISLNTPFVLAIIQNTKTIFRKKNKRLPQNLQRYLKMIVLFVSMSSIGMSAHKGSLKATAFFLPTRTAIPVNLSQKDSTLEQQYKKAETLFENKKYVEGLKLLLELNESVKKTQNKWLQYKTIFLIGEIHRKNSNHDKAISYYKNSLKQLDSILLDGQKMDYSYQKYLAENLLRLGSRYQLLKKK